MQQAAGAALWREASGPSGPIVVAVSGGLDSVLLLHALVEARDRLWPAGHRVDPRAGPDRPALVCVHVHHGVRGAEADADAAFVERLAVRLGVPFARLDADRDRVWKRGIASEGRMRAERYRLLGAWALAHRCRTIFVAHHRDDRIESLVLATVRGAGLRGLAGMARRRPLRADDRAGPWLVRPWFALTRATLLAAAHQCDLQWCEDASNADLGPRRNRVRHLVLPRLRADFGETFGDRLVHLSRLARVLVRRARRTVEPRTSDAIHARCEWLAGVPLRKSASLRIQDLVRRGISGAVDVGPGVRVRVRDGSVEVESHHDPLAAARIEVRLLGPRVARVVAALPTARLRERLVTRGFLYLDLDLDLDLDGDQAHARAAVRPEALRFRPREAGDRIDWPGLEQPVRLKSLLASHHVPRAWRDALVVVEWDGRITAIEGLGTASWTRVTAASRTLVRITIRRSDDAPQARTGRLALPSAAWEPPRCSSESSPSS